MPNGILVCYRNDESAGWARELRRSLALEFGERRLVELSDAAGTDGIRMADCSVCLLVIGKSWLGASRSDGARCLDDSADAIRRVVETGLESGLRIIPLLLDGAKMPSARDLPAAVAALASRQAVAMSRRLPPGDIRALTLIIAEGREGDLTPSSEQLLWAGAYACVVPALSSQVAGRLLKIVFADFYAYDRELKEITLEAAIWFVAFVPLGVLGYWLVRRRGAQTTEPERTFFTLGMAMVAGSGLLALMRIIDREPFGIPPAYLTYYMTMLVAFALVLAMIWSRFAARGAALPREEWLIACAAIFIWVFVLTAPLYERLELSHTAPLDITHTNSQVFQIVCGLIMALLAALFARTASKKPASSPPGSAS